MPGEVMGCVWGRRCGEGVGVEGGKHATIWTTSPLALLPEIPLLSCACCEMFHWRT